ncbi:MAG: DegT/DnrJ/EryC1/StrS family aminotransferase [Planctomycetota bacterium]|nr:MAG: DegT/DnrJ/EryC1/StrS family aminotransferase [Planctomycetota bacterium]
MAVPFFDIHYNLGPAQRAAILRRWQGVLEHGKFILGPEVAELEQNLAAFLDVRHVIGCSNGSDALVLALRAMDVRPGDEVIVPSFTFFATAGAVARVGATPVFADIDPRTFCLSVADAARRATRRTAAVIPVHLFGHPAPIEPLREALARAAGRDVAVIEDAAQAIGTASPEGPIGGLGRVSAWSCFPTKNLGALGDAGFVSTPDAAVAARVRALREHGGARTYFHDEVGYNFRMDALQAAALLERLPHLLEWNAARVVSARHYRDLIREHGLEDVVTAPQIVPGHVFHQYVVRVRQRDALRASLSAAGIGTAVYYPLPLHLQPCFAPLGGRPGDLPEAERASQEVLALPIHPGVTPQQRQEVVAGIAAHFRSHSAVARGRS